MYANLMENSAMASSSADFASLRRAKQKILYRIERILDQMRPENIYVLKGQIVNAGVTSPDILEGVICLIFDKAVSGTTFHPMYAQLCCILSRELPSFPSDEPDGRPISFMRILLDICQEAFEGSDNLREKIKQTTAHDVVRRGMERRLKLRTIGNIRLIGELFKIKMIPEKIVHHCIQELLGVDKNVVPPEECVEALCQLLISVGKCLEQNPKSQIINDSYFARMKGISSDQNLPSGVKLMVLDVLHLRARNWIPEIEEVKADTLDMHSQPQMSFRIQSKTERMSARKFVTANIALTKPPTDLDKW